MYSYLLSAERLENTKEKNQELTALLYTLLQTNSSCSFIKTKGYWKDAVTGEMSFENSTLVNSVEDLTPFIRTLCLMFGQQAYISLVGDVGTMNFMDNSLQETSVILGTLSIDMIDAEECYTELPNGTQFCFRT